MEFKDKLKARRLELGLTLDELAKKVGVSSPTISRYESGEIKNVRRDKIKFLADALEVTPGYLMGWEEETIDNFKIDTRGINTIAAHFEGDNFTENDKLDIENFIKYVLSKKDKK